VLAGFGRGSQRIMVYWSLARAGLGREPGTADFFPAF
jgi:hypothetical protein